MQANRSRDTSCELAVRRLLHAEGLRYRVNTRPEPSLRRTADIVFRPVKIAVFIDGCFWHGCPDHFKPPRVNDAYWSPKITRNIERDAETTTTLEQAGWTVLRYWEHEDPAATASKIANKVRARRRRLS